MGVYLQNKETKLFYRGTEQWTRHIEKAYDFGSIITANDFATKNNLLKVTHIYMNWGAARWDVTLPFESPGDRAVE